MAFVVKDRVQETTTTTGTGTLTLDGAVLGFQTFAIIGNGNTTYYAIADPATGDWEVGLGTYTASGTTLSRTTVFESSNSGSLVNFAAGSKNVFCTYPAERAVYLDAAGSAVTVLDIGTLGASTANITTANITSGTVSTTPTNNTDIVNKAYADAIASGIHFHEAVGYATTAALPACTYNNGTSGVGATLTGDSNGALTVDGHTFTSPTDNGTRVLIKNQANGAHNGVYTLTQAGNSSPGAPFILTRATDFDTVGTGVDQIDEGDFFLVTGGSANLNTAWVQQTAPPITIGTTPLVFQQFAAPITYSAGTGLSESPSYTFNIANVGTASTYGSASSVPVFTTNAQGQVTGVTPTGIAIASGAVSGLAASATTDTTDASNITTGTLGTSRLSGSYTGITGVGTLTAGTWNATAISAVYGGTGLTSYAVGDLLYADTTTSLAKLADVAVGNALISGGVAAAPSYGKIGLSTHVDGTLPIANGGTGSTSTQFVALGTNVSGTLPVANGGTGAATLTTNNVLLGNGTSALQVVAPGTNGNVLQSNGTTWVSAANPSSQVYPGVGIANSTGTSWATSYSTTGSGTVVALATSPSFTTPILGTPQSGNFSTGTFTWPTFNQSTTGNAATATTATNQSGGTVSATTGAFSSTITSSRAPAAINTTTPGLTNYGLVFNGAASTDNAQALTWTWDSGAGAQAGIYVQSSGAYGTKMYLATTDSFATGAKTAISIDHLGAVNILRSSLTANGTVAAAGASGFTSSTFVVNSRNPIWRFGNADAYGMSYFQATAGIGGLDTIGFHFGTATAAASAFKFISNGNFQATGTVTAPTFSGNATTATALSSGQTNWSGTGVLGNVVGLMAWKNYGNSHVIFDASNSTSPSGGAVNNTNSTSAWTATYPTLMGWNGAQTYGVRVDSARVSDNSSALGGYGSSTFIGQLGNTYYQANTWLQFNGNYGLYWPAVFGCHFDPNNSSTYTQFQFRGSKNGYSGYYDVHSAVNQCMYDGSGNGGVYREANGRWFFYHNLGNNCMGIGTSTTSASYGIYVIKGVYSEGNVVAYSDERVKTNWRDYPVNFVEQLAKLKHGTYDRTDIELTQDGVSAQSLQTLLPYSAPEDENGNLAVNYGGAALVSAVELAKRVIEQDERIAALEAIVAKLS
jgi:hypothetical protein